jgi:hypothetical protein
MKIGMPLGIPSVSPATDSHNPCLSGRSGSKGEHWTGQKNETVFPLGVAVLVK